MEIIVVTVIIVIAFIGLLVTIAANVGEKQVQESEPQQTEVTTVVSSGNDFALDDVKIAMCFNIAGINMHECTLDYVGPFEGYIEAEPDNAYDHNAIKVMHRDGAKLGYIKAVETESVRKLFGGKLDYPWPVVGYVKHIIRPGSIWSDEKDEKQQMEENGYFVARIYIDGQTLCEF